MATEKRVSYRRPLPIKGKGARKDQNKYYWFHRNNGHNTNDYYDLKDEIEGLIRWGYLRRYQ
ncbi:hypothetical protein PanWU01x14_283620 [Parasponia andersonii]|uniref:Uncharacterized protein n=1 Tax=Parasponia andersonii TaxID=3476 RepID=A0A2P5B0G7_PARAD|nr:hypothetical protein PanWU01x14_283620 [Parasponia andersonii]